MAVLDGCSPLDQGGWCKKTTFQGRLVAARSWASHVFCRAVVQSLRVKPALRGPVPGPQTPFFA
ncbi:hypothetical protein [Archangium sp.]|uniref:hypothetical protein n=1 Tax=Archangium sp. TaxID=1872627 RepID=UPI0039C86872